MTNKVIRIQKTLKWMTGGRIFLGQTIIFCLYDQVQAAFVRNQEISQNKYKSLKVIQRQKEKFKTNIETNRKA